MLERSLELPEQVRSKGVGSEVDDRQVRLCCGRSKVDLPQLQELLNASAFWARGRSLEDLRIAIAHSSPVFSAWKGRRMIGFARATSDRVFRATIWDVVVHPGFQGIGLGRKLISRVFSHPYVRCVERVYLMTSHQQHFYRRLGFEANPTTTMVAWNTHAETQINPADLSVARALEADEAGAG